MKIIFGKILLMSGYVLMLAAAIIIIIGMIGYVKDAHTFGEAYDRLTQVWSPYNVGHYILVTLLSGPGFLLKLAGEKILEGTKL
jgi:hypothetical protein